MATAMSKIYYELVKNGKRTLAQVPKSLRKEVEDLLNEEVKENVDEEN